MLLEKIKDKLSECYKKNKPVLLYGDDSINRFELILDIHIKNGGIVDAVEYISSNDEPDGNVFLERMVKEIEKAEKDSISEIDLISLNMDIYDCSHDQIVAGCNIIKKKIYNKVREAFGSTEKTWLYHNCEYTNSVYKSLTARGDWHHFEMNDYIHNEGPNITGRYLYDFKGSLYLDNLKCKASNSRDIQHYSKFGIEIRDKNLSVNWLVAYVSSLDDFPDIFLNQFELISLDNSVEEVNQQKRKASAAPAEKLYKPEASIEGKEIGEGQASKLEVKLKIVQGKEEVYWDGNLLHSIRGTDFSILNELAKTTGKLVENEKLNGLINSDCYKDVLLNQRITAIRKAFPPPYNDIKQSQCIIPDGKRNKGYRRLNLTKKQVKIVKK
jgi:hypothetical protein